MKIIPSQFQFWPKMANTSFLFYHRLKLTEKGCNESTENFSFFYALHLNSAEKYLNKTTKTFFKVWSSPKKLRFYIRLLLKIRLCNQKRLRTAVLNSRSWQVRN